MNFVQNDKNMIAQIYDAIAADYEVYTQPLTYSQDTVHKFLKENVRAGQRVLDLACGPGHLTRDLPLDVDVVGLDISHAMVETAKRNRPSSTYLVHDFHHPLPAELGKFDVIVANGCFDFCEDLEKVMNNAATALADGGRFYFTINERRPELPYHDARWIDIGNEQINIRMFFWSFIETATALEKVGLQPLSYHHTPGWESRDIQATIYYGYWVVEG